MLKIVATVNNRKTLFLGLDRANTTRLHLGKPIVVDAQALIPTGTGQVQDIVLCAAETAAELHAELSRYMPLPPYVETGPDDAPVLWSNDD